MAGLREKSVEIYHVHQIKRNSIVDCVCYVMLLPLWVISVLKRGENINRLKNITDILNIVVKIRDCKTIHKIIHYLTIMQNIVITEISVLNVSIIISSVSIYTYYKTKSSAASVCLSVCARQTRKLLHGFSWGFHQ